MTIDQGRNANEMLKDCYSTPKRFTFHTLQYGKEVMYSALHFDCQPVAMTVLGKPCSTQYMKHGLSSDTL